MVQDRLTYARLIIRDAMRHGGRGWLDYNGLFRQQAALNPSLAWNALYTSLMASTILGQWSAGQGTFCFMCQGFNHTPSQCTLAFLQKPTQQDSLLGRPSSNRMSHQVCWSWNGVNVHNFLLNAPSYITVLPVVTLNTKPGTIGTRYLIPASSSSLSNVPPAPLLC